MLTEISSKFTIGFWLRGVALSFIACCLVLPMIYPAAFDKSPLPLAFRILFPIPVVCFYIYLAVNMLRKIIVAPEYLIFDYLLINKKITVEYEKMVNVKNVRIPQSRGAFYYILEIELENGETHLIRENHIDNYNEIKEAITRQRFMLGYKKIFLLDNPRQKSIGS